MEIFDIENVNTHGGSNRYYIKNKKNKFFKINNKVQKNINLEKRFGLHKFKTYKRFANKVSSSRKKLNKIFDKIKSENKKVIGYGATAKSCTVLNYCKIGSKKIDFFYDTTSYKIGKLLPGSKIKIKKYKKLSIKDVEYVFLGAWNFKSEIFKKEKNYIRQGGRFITHIPSPKII